MNRIILESYKYPTLKITLDMTLLFFCTLLSLEQKVVIAMVGLPARGKSYIVRMIMRHLKWQVMIFAISDIAMTHIF